MKNTKTVKKKVGRPKDPWIPKRKPPKPRKRLPHIDGDFDLFAADLSMRRPGFAHLHYNAAARSASVVRRSYVGNKRAPTGTPEGKPHGQILDEIYEEAYTYIVDTDISVFVCEMAFARFSKDTAAIHKTHGMFEYLLWHYRGLAPQEIAPKSIKKIVTGSGVADKDEVAAALEQFVGKITYACDDESDAVAAGIAWLIENGYIDSPYKQEETKCHT